MASRPIRAGWARYGPNTKCERDQTIDTDRKVDQRVRTTCCGPNEANRTDQSIRTAPFAWFGLIRTNRDGCFKRSILNGPQHRDPNVRCGTNGPLRVVPNATLEVDQLLWTSSIRSRQAAFWRAIVAQCGIEWCQSKWTKQVCAAEWAMRMVQNARCSMSGPECSVRNVW